MKKIDDQVIDQAFADYKAAYGGVRNDFFAPAYLAVEHQIDIEKALLHTTFGGNDYGFDAFHFDQATGNLYLYQFKWSEDASLFKDCYRRMIDAGIDRIFAGSFQDTKQNQALLQIKSLLLEKKALVNGAFIRFVFKGDPKDAENCSFETSGGSRIEKIPNRSVFWPRGEFSNRLSLVPRAHRRNCGSNKDAHLLD